VGFGGELADGESQTAASRATRLALAPPGEEFGRVARRKTAPAVAHRHEHAVAAATGLDIDLGRLVAMARRVVDKVGDCLREQAGLGLYGRQAAGHAQAD